MKINWLSLLPLFANMVATTYPESNYGHKQFYYPDDGGATPTLRIESNYGIVEGVPAILCSIGTDYGRTTHGRRRPIEKGPFEFVNMHLTANYGTIEGIPVITKPTSENTDIRISPEEKATLDRLQTKLANAEKSDNFEVQVKN